MKVVGLSVVALLFVALASADRERRSASGIAWTAEQQEHSREWSKAGCKHSECGQWKCNMFVADMIAQAGYTYPSRRWWYSPIGANEWANPRSRYLTRDDCWELTTSPSRGDVAAVGGHVGIVTRYGQTVSATEHQVVINDWGFRAGQRPTFWTNVPC